MSFPASLRAYAQFARCAFQRRAAYRLANWTGITVNFFFFLIHAQVFLAFFGTRVVDGWRAGDAVRYFATSESLLMVIGMMSSQAGVEFAERIRTGDIAVDLVRPVRLWARYLAESYGSAVYYVLMRAVVIYAGAMLLYGLALPRTAGVWLAPLSIALAVGVAGAMMYLAAATAFWTEQAHGPLLGLVLATFFFGGAIVPLDFYPDAVRVLANVLPFRAAIYTPVALASGMLVGSPLLFGLVHQVVWLGLLFALAERVERRGTERLALQGG